MPLTVWHFGLLLQLWHELCDLISQNPDKVKSLNVGAIIRGGLTRFTDQLGKLWCSLADYYIRSGHFEKVGTESSGLHMMIQAKIPSLEEISQSIDWAENSHQIVLYP